MENRESFFKRLVFLPEADLMRIQLAYTLAKFFHRAQTRKELDEQGHEIRYFEHLRRVALILVDELKICDPNMIIAALLHDAIEDSKEAYLTPKMIEFHFGTEVYTLVRILSKAPKEGYLQRLIDFANWKALMIKGCDRLDNLRSLQAGSVDFQKKQIEETRTKYYPVFDKLVRISPQNCVVAASYIREQIKNITEHFIVK